MEGTELKWRKSSYSGNGGGECVEVGASPGRVVVRDTTDRTGPVLRFTSAAWRRFAGQVKRALASSRPPRNSVDLGIPYDSFLVPYVCAGGSGGIRAIALIQSMRHSR